MHATTLCDTSFKSAVSRKHKEVTQDIFSTCGQALFRSNMSGDMLTTALKHGPREVKAGVDVASDGGIRHKLVVGNGRKRSACNGDF